MKTLLVIYQTAQVSRLEKVYSEFLTNDKEVEILALGADVEFLLKEKNIPHTSGRKFRRRTPPEHLFAAVQLGEQVLHDRRFKFFEYRGISLGELYTMAFQDYLVRFFYYLSLARSVFAAYPEVEVRLLQTSDMVSPTSGLLAVFEARVTIDAFELVAKAEKRLLEILGEPPVWEASITRRSEKAKRIVSETALSIFNYIMFLLPRKRVRIFASDYWKNISPLLGELPDAELLLLDRAQIKNVRFADLLRHHMRFVKIDSYVRARERAGAKGKVTFFNMQWKTARNLYAASYSYDGYSLDSFLEKILDRIVSVGGEHAVLTIDGSYRMLTKLQPDIVLVRASISAQPHFAILCRVSSALAIPSVELQHGIFYLGEGSFVRNRTAEYIAEYGAQSRSELQEIGYRQDQLFDVGSPRFDAYSKMKAYDAKQKESVTIGCIAPEVLTGSWNDSYDVYDYFAHFAEAVSSIPNVSVIIKLRATELNYAFYQKALAQAFSKTPYSVLRYEPLQDLLERSDFIVTCYSTALLEVLLCGIPMVYEATLPMQNELGKSLHAYEESGALIYAKTQEELEKAVKSLSEQAELRANYSRGAREFMNKNYLFDGQTSARLAGEIRKLAERERKADTK
jgi:hypothetical protein